MKKTLTKNIYKTNLAIALISSMIIYLGFTFAFMHVHVMTNGEIVCHSHAAKTNETSDQSKKSNHTHSKDEFLFYNLTTNLNKFLISIVFIIFGLGIQFFILIHIKNLQHQIIQFFYSQRAPPYIFNFSKTSV